MIEPYYETKLGKLYHGDCLDIMQDIPDKSIDMILCDLPYGVTQHAKDIVIDFIPLWENYERIIKDNGAIVLFGQGLFFIDLVNSNRKLFRYDLIWDKQLVSGFLNANRCPLRCHENIAVFYKKMPVYNPQYHEGEPSHSRGTAYLNKTVKNENYGGFNPTEDKPDDGTRKYPRSILSFQKTHPSKALHRTEKSIDLLEYLVKTYSNESDTILDNTCGSGTTLLSCEKTNRKWIGIELDKKYCEVSKKRISKLRKEMLTFGELS